MEEPDRSARPREIGPRQGEPGDQASEPLRPRRGPEPARARRARVALAGVVLALFLAMLAAEALTGAGLQQTSLFYVGIPAVIALAVILTARRGTPWASPWRRPPYRRTFDPSWYFGPVQRYATDRAAAYLLETFVASARAEAPSGA